MGVCCDSCFDKIRINEFIEDGYDFEQDQDVNDKCCCCCCCCCKKFCCCLMFVFLPIVILASVGIYVYLTYFL
ncbi:hypothetical protein AYR72_gp097 [Cnaphalocrocis medinalis granulovirus]|uniref:Uncharacterized protein n=2 Tax=Cnaphalocrocis medinalis granulovirus TaxID=1750712 RepID=A0ACD3YJ36_9BBAC|nr:hypothetical protein AYR72_gp097 [Cnaphalocrocis medinalis granulovirus]ALN42040.1 ORF107 [Cnaphalocrocis medinalis granulovirus]UNZ38133.1 hypothetical protein [Cnaphalocrocis medinalis granulovirus]